MAKQGRLFENGGAFKRTPSPRPAKPYWNAIVAVWFPGGVPDSQKTRIGKLVREFRKLGAVPEDIGVRHQRILDAYGAGRATPENLVKHWGDFPPPKSAADRYRSYTAMGEAEARRKHEANVEAERQAADAVLAQHTEEQVEAAFQQHLATVEPGVRKRMRLGHCRSAVARILTEA